jgi:hypothetical protein
MTPEEMIKKLDELKSRHMEQAWQVRCGIEAVISELGQISTCVWGSPQVDRVNGEDSTGYYEEIEVFQYCIAHGVKHYRHVAWLGDRTPDGMIPLREPGTRRWFAAIRPEPAATLADRAVYAYETVVNSPQGA